MHSRTNFNGLIINQERKILGLYSKPAFYLVRHFKNCYRIYIFYPNWKKNLLKLYRMFYCISKQMDSYLIKIIVLVIKTYFKYQIFQFSCQYNFIGNTGNWQWGHHSNEHFCCIGGFHHWGYTNVSWKFNSWNRTRW